MKHLLVFLSLVLFLSACNIQFAERQQAEDTNVEQNKDSDNFDKPVKPLSSLNNITIKELENKSSHFSASYEIMIEQPLDHKDVKKGVFTQKFYLNHIDYNAPMIFNINGYSVPNNGFTSELVPWLNANQIHVEHRFFGDSKPNPLDYDYLTIEQAAADHHNIIQTLKKLYTGRWLSTGISKGGQATTYHRSFYPDDVDMSIPYVAPINLAKEDNRLITFLDEVGAPECRERILDYQRTLLTDYENSFSSFIKIADERKLTFPMSQEKAFELSILEFEFAYWQWSGGDGCDNIPVDKNEIGKMIDYLYVIDAPGFFTTPSIEYFFPFFYQAYAELGMYGYAVDSLDGYLKEYTAYVDNYETFIPQGFKLVYNPEPLQKVYNFLENEGQKFIFIYGENDAWSATAYHPVNADTTVISLFKEDGSHFTRINSLEQEQKEMVFDKIEKWMSVEIEQ